MHKKKPMRPSTVVVLLAVILLMLVLSYREQNKSYAATAPLSVVYTQHCR